MRFWTPILANKQYAVNAIRAARDPDHYHEHDMFIECLGY